MAAPAQREEEQAALTQPEANSAVAIPASAMTGKSVSASADVHRHRDAGEEHRRARILAREIAGREHLDHDEGRQAEREDGERIGGDRRRLRRERAALVEHAHDLLRR